MKPLTTTDKIKVTDGDALLWYNFKNGKGVYEVDNCLARDVVSSAEIFYYKRNAMWRKANLNKNNLVECPYDKGEFVVSKSYPKRNMEGIVNYEIETWQMLPAEFDNDLMKLLTKYAPRHDKPVFYNPDTNPAKVQLDSLMESTEKIMGWLEQSNAEKQQWKQMAHTLADALEGIYFANLTDDPDKMRKMRKAIDQFRKLQS